MADTTTFAPILTPSQVHELVIRPLTQQSIAGQTMTTVLINEHSYRFPIVTADPSAGWVAESAEIPVSDMTLTEQVATPSKLAALSVISQELADDSSPPAVAAVGAGIVRDLTRKLDQALFTATTTNGPGGLPGVTAVSAGASYANVDSFTAAVYSAAQQNATIDSWVTNPATAQTLASLKEATGSNKPLLGPDPSKPGSQQILGIPLLTSPYVTTTNNVVWGIPRAYTYLVIRQNATVESDSSVFFTSHRVAIRAILRVALGFPHPAALVKISTT